MLEPRVYLVPPLPPPTSVSWALRGGFRARCLTFAFVPPLAPIYTSFILHQPFPFILSPGRTFLTAAGSECEGPGEREVKTVRSLTLLVTGSNGPVGHFSTTQGDSGKCDGKIRRTGYLEAHSSSWDGFGMLVTPSSVTPPTLRWTLWSSQDWPQGKVSWNQPLKQFI